MQLVNIVHTSGMHAACEHRAHIRHARFRIHDMMLFVCSRHPHAVAAIYFAFSQASTFSMLRA
jgi:hypothetical protein